MRRYRPGDVDLAQPDTIVFDGAVERIVDSAGDHSIVLTAGHGSNQVAVLHLHNPGRYEIELKTSQW